QPIERDVSLIARGQFRDERGDPVTTEWIDVTDPLIDELRHNRLTPVFLVELGLSNAVVTFDGAIQADPRATVKENGKRYIKSQIPASVDPLDMLVMRRTAVATLEIANGGKPMEQVQLALMRYVFPRFTERHKKETSTERQATLVDWQPATWVDPY